MRKFLSDIRFLTGRQDLWRFSALLGALVVNSCLELLSLATVPLFISLLLAGGRPDGSAGVDWLVRAAARCHLENGNNILWFSGLLVLSLNLLRVLWMRTCIALQARMLNHRKVALASRLLEVYLRAPAEFHSRFQSSDLMNRVVVECDHVLQHVVAPALDFSQNCVIILCICVLLLCWMPAMTAVAIAALGLFGGGYLALHQRRMRRLGEQEQRSRTQAMGVATEALSGRVEATLLGKRHYVLSRFHHAMERVAEAQQANDVQIRVIWPYLEFVSLSVILLVTLSSLVIHHGDLGAVAPRIALLGMALVRLRTNAINLMHSWTLLRYHQVSLRLVCEDLRNFARSAAAERSLDQEEAVPACGLAHAIELREVSFRYPGASADTLR
ncbi:MAG: ABC transporter ATP-binding protein, partial [Victivallales bacterium]|nr:ABC transporter ATP-binding protein [Victivallales bacterium]